jgi:hypothetical protein
MWFPLRVSVALALAVLTAGVMPSAAGAAPPGGQVTLVPCGDVAPDASCGTLAVPLDRRAPLGATIMHIDGRIGRRTIALSIPAT